MWFSKRSLPCLAITIMLLSVGSLVTSVQAAAIPLGKLSDIATPKAYRLDLTILPDQDRFSGHTEIDIMLKSKVTFLFMHGRDLNVTRAIALCDGQTIPLTWTQVDPSGVVRIDFSKPVPAGPVTLKFDYDAPFGDGPAGLYHIRVAGDWYSWSQFESIDARAAFPSFDQPGFKTPFSVHLTTKPGFVAVSNAPEIASKSAGGLVEHDFGVTKPLPTYLIAFVVGPFISVQGTAPPTPQRPYPLPIQIVATKPNADRMAFVLKETPSIVAHLEAYFNKPFPFPKLSQIASPVMPGAMENAGADTYEDNIILLDSDASTTQQKQFGMIVSHELSHQWFGDYVTPAWWDDIWLNESFANWMGYRIGDAWQPNLNIGDGAVDEAFRSMNTDALKAGRSIRQPILSSSEVDGAFDSITYGKGGQVVAMIAGYLGDDRFRAGVRLHMSRHPYGNANSDQFFKALADSVKDPTVLDSIKSFVNQPGFPVVRFSRRGRALVLTQSRYARLGTRLPDESWTIPICLRLKGRRTCKMMTQKTMAISGIGAGVLMPNAGGTGYYRFTLDPEDWQALIKVGDTLPSAEGLAMIDSLWGEFYAGHGQVSQLIDAARIMVNNPKSSVAVAGGQNLAYLRARGFIPDASLTDYQRVLAGIYGPRLSALGLNPKVGAYGLDSPDRLKLRQDLANLVATEANDPKVRKVLDDAAKAYLVGDTGALDEGFMGLALAVHVADGHLPAAQDLYERMLSSGDEVFRGSALRAVTAGADLETAQWVLAQLGDKRLRSPDRQALILGLFANPATRDLTYAWFKINYATLSSRAGIFSAGRIASLPGAYCSADKADDIDKMMRPQVIAAGRGELSFDRMLETMRDCSLLKAAEEGHVVAALKSAS